MDNINIDKNTLDNLKNMMGEENVNDALSKISPEMLANFSKMMSNNSNNENSNKSNTNSNSQNSSGFNLDGIDMATMMKIKSAIEAMNSSKDDPRSNLLNSLKPYMRESRKENIDKYSNFLKMANIANMFNENNNDNKK